MNDKSLLPESDSIADDIPLKNSVDSRTGLSDAELEISGPLIQVTEDPELSASDPDAVGIRVNSHMTTANPTVLDRWAAAVVCIVPVVLVPAVACQLVRNIEGLRLLCSLLAWSILPIGIVGFRCLWRGGPAARANAVQAVGLLAVAWLMMPIATGIVGGICQWFLSFFIGERILLQSLTALIAGAGIGLVWLESFIFVGLERDEERPILIPWYASSLAVGMLPMLVGHWMTEAGRALTARPAGTLGEFISLTLIASLMSMLSARQMALEPCHAGQTQLRMLWTAGLPVMLCGTALGLGLAVTPLENSPLLDRSYWNSVAWFQFLRLH